ncbi:cation efflux protein, CzcI family [Cupriavidus basilensis]|nr:cation efflux protein, CzcI family [Cupriavidus basilensis]
MRRFLILLFAIMLPLQFAWAGAAAYCNHESTQPGNGTATASASWHFGHHSHAHQGKLSQHDGKDSNDSKSGKDNIKLPDLDCAVCHFASAQLVLPDMATSASQHGVAISYRALAASYLSAPGATPDRPQWPLAA